MKKRSINIDLVKCIAVFSVISVHFFLNTNFYSIVVSGKYMYFWVVIRTLFMICVPLFLLATGYLMKDKKLSLKYYKGISRVLITYVLATVLIMLYNHFYLGEIFTIRSLVANILKFDVGYCWYINMYIGLFLLIPFLNLIYNNLDTKKKKIVLVITMLFLTSFQGIVNIKYKIIPTWWTGIYPLTYYFIGCYLREYKINISKIVNIIMFVFVLGVSSIANIYLSRGKIFVLGTHNGWESIFNVLTSVLLFIFILNLNTDKLNVRIKRIIIAISKLSLGIYLISYLTDNYLYNYFYERASLLNIMGYFKTALLSFVLSVSLSMIINYLYLLINKIIQKVLNLYKNVFLKKI